MIERNVIIYVLAGLLAIASWWWLQLSPVVLEKEAVLEKHSVDYYSSGYQKREMDALGLLKREVRAVKMQHYSDDGSVHLQAPEIRFFNDKLPPWLIQAERGVLSNGGKELWLHGAVLVSRAATKSGRAIMIKTSEVRVQPETSYAETAQSAELSSPPNVTTGVGLQLSFADPIRITLLNKVRGKYEIN
ncbi:MAG: LPS export ABC transporter periplasmic protein LptC [Methylococcaceae bacterium]|nr:LPS export ABC transporter periplasmic protein LptC [Methylococcaceae bacterium]